MRNVRFISGKRLADIVLALLLMVLFSPLMIFISFLVFLFLGPPILFRQQRIGLRQQTFSLLKFRTMQYGLSGVAGVASDSERLTRFGKILRMTSLDELPQLFNVLRGQMSLVGPRPLFPEYLAHYTAEQNRRHEVRPGITGLAQVSGRNALSWEQRFKLDVLYVDNASFWLDFKILCKTVIKVILRSGSDSTVYQELKPFGQSNVQNRVVSMKSHKI